MLNFKSVSSSELQIRSNPTLRHVNPKSGFQKRISTLLEPTPLPFPTFQMMKDASRQTISQNTYYAWVRPAHLRSAWLVLTADMPLLMVDSRDMSRMFSMRIPFDKRRVQHTGPIVCEAAWDAQDHVLWIWDVVLWERQVIWNMIPYSKRWDILKEVVGKILDCGHPMSDAEVRVPDWVSLSEISKMEDIDVAYSIDFQPESPGSRRHVFRQQNNDIAFKPISHAERKMVANTPKPVAFVPVAVPVPAAVAVVATPVLTPLPNPEPVQETLQKSITERPTVAIARKDALSKLPDTYMLETVTGESLGLASIRVLSISKQLQHHPVVSKGGAVLVDILWYEPFSKYVIRNIH
jgi:hypothetical protein